MSHSSNQFLGVDLVGRRFTPRVQLYIPTPDTFLKRCSAWYSAGHLSLSDGAAVGSWPDAGSGDIDLSAFGTIRPVFKTGIVNGHPAVLFDGSNDAFVGANDDVLLGSSRTGTVVVVYKVTAGGVGLGYLAYTGGATPRGCYDGQATSPGFFSVAYDGTVDSVSQAAPTETWHVGVWTISGGSVRGGVDNPDTSALASAVTGTQTGSAAAVLIGGDGIGNQFKGYIAELAFFNEPLTEAERQSLVSYFATKYGLSYPGSQPAAPSQTGGWVDVGEDVVGSVKVDWGIHGSGLKDRVAGAGSMKFELDNSTGNAAGLRGWYSPGHASCRVGFVVGVPARLLFYQLTESGLGRVKWQGVLESVKPAPGAADRRTSVNCVDWMEEAARAKLSGLAVQVNTQADALFNTLLAASNKQPPNGTRVGSGSDAYPFALDTAKDESTRLVQELAKLAQTEFGYVFLEAGTLVLESRQTRSGTSSVKYALDEDTNIVKMVVSNERDDIYNRVQVVVHPRRRDAAATTQLFQLGSSAQVTRNTSVTINCPYRDPNQQAQRVAGVDMVTPVATTDYTFNTASDGTESDITGQVSIVTTFGGNAATLVITNNGPLDGYLTSLKLRGRGLYDFEPVISDREDQVSITTYGENAYGYDMPYQASPERAADLAFFILSLNKNPRTRVASVTFVANWDEEAVSQAFDLKVSDRVSVTSPTIGLTARPYFVNGFRLDIDSSGVVLVTLDLAPVDTVNYWVLEVAGRTELDQTTVLGYGLFVAGWILDSSQLGTGTFLN